MLSEVPTWVLIVAGVAAVGLVLAVVAMVSQRQRSRRLKGRFGPEYDQAVRELGGRSRAEQALTERLERVSNLRLRSFTSEERDRYAGRWQELQAQFIDEPVGAVAEADRVITEAMGRLGYPVDSFEQRAADVSVDHPTVIQNYRKARAIAVRGRDGTASTEDLRQAVVHYRALFEELLGTGTESAMRNGDAARHAG